MLHKITLTTVGSGISNTLDIHGWVDPNWVLIESAVPKASLQAGYVFDDDGTGAILFRVSDKGTCGTTLELECEGTPPTTTLEITTTPADTTTIDPTTTIP